MENNLPVYLQEPFEASSLTILEIIQILTHHGVPLPSARQRKAFYVELINKSLEQYKEEWIAEFQKSKNPFQSFTQSPVVISPLRKSPRKTPQRTPKSTPSREKKETPKNAPPKDNDLSFQTPTKSKVPTVKTPYVVRTAPAAPQQNKFRYGSILILLFAMVISSKWLTFCDDKHSFLCLPCPRFSKCSGRTILKCTSPDWELKRGWWMTEWNSNYILWPFNIDYCQDKTRQIAKETKKLLKLGMMLNKIVNTWVGKAECGEIIQNDKNSWAWSKSNSKMAILGMPVSIAKEMLKSMAGSHKDEEFEDLWMKLLDNIMGSAKKLKLELELVLDDTHRQHRLFKSFSPPIHSFSCQLKMGLLGLAQRYSMTLIGLGSLLALLTIFYARKQASLREAMVINRLVEDILDAIQQETHLHTKDKTKHPFPGLSLSQLKDHFLPLFSSKQRGLKPLDPISGFPCESDANDRTRWYLDELTRSRVWSRVYATLGSNTLLKEAAMDVSGETQNILVFVGSHSLGWSTPKAKESPKIVENF